MKEIHCRLLLTHCAATRGRGTRYAPTPRQLRELQLGVCQNSRKYFSGQKRGKKKSRWKS